jgi:FixJ family two-component response regulator
MNEPDSIVFVVDDDPSIRRAIKRLVESVGLHVEVFGSVAEFRSSSHPDIVSCLILDIRLPGVSGLDFQRQLSKTKINIPIIFISAHGDVPMTVRAIKAGAIEFHSPNRSATRICWMRFRSRFASLSPREREVIAMVASGMPNKQTAAEIGITENTVKVHRSRAMEKMQAQSLPDLVKMVERLKTEDTLAIP